MSEAIRESLPLLPPEPDRVEVDDDYLKRDQPVLPVATYDPQERRYHLRPSPDSVEE